MEKERGSLHDRLRGFGAEPDPAILLRLQEELAANQKRKKRPVFWWMAAILLLSGAFISGWFFTKQSSPLAGNVGTANETNRVSDSKAERSGRLSTTGNNEKKSATSDDPHNSQIQKRNSAPELASISESQNQVLHKSVPAEEAAVISKKNNNLKKRKLTLAITGPTGSGRQWSEKNRPSGEKSGKSIALIPAEKQTPPSLPRVENTGSENSGTQKDDVRLQNSQVANTSSEKNPNLASSADPTKNQKDQEGESTLNDNQERSFSGEKEDKNQTLAAEPGQNPYAGGKTDSLQKPQTTALIPKTDSVQEGIFQDSAVKKAMKNKTWFWALSGGSRYSAQRFISATNPSSEQQITIQNQPQSFPARFTFELQGSVSKKISDRVELFTGLQTGYRKEILGLELKDQLEGQYQYFNSGNELVVRPVNQVSQYQHVAENLYLGLLAGLGIQIPVVATKIRFGYGMQLRVWENHTREGSDNGQAGLAGKVLPWIPSYRISAEKTIWTGKRGRWSLEPLVVLYPKNEMEWGGVIKMKTWQSGLQINWHW
jgi:hypothetical protein